MSRDELASRLGVSMNTIARWERCESFPDAREIETILKMWPNFSPAWFILDEGPIMRGEVVKAEGVMEAGPQVFVSPRANDPDLTEILDILQHDLPEAKRFVLQVLRGRKETKKGLEGLGMKLKEDS